MQLEVCKLHEKHTPIQAPLKVGLWEGCPAPKIAPQSSFTSLHSHPHSHRETIYSPVEKEGHRGAHCCDCLELC